MRELPAELVAALQACPYAHLPELWREILTTGGEAMVPALCRADRFYLLVQVMRRPDMRHPWLYARCREVEANPDGFLDLWAREHGKTSLISQAGVMQEIVRDPDITIGIFSNVKALARKIVWQLKTEMESNLDLKKFFPDIFWQDPQREAPRWSVDGGLVVRRPGNPKEATVEGHGLVDGQPIGAHYRLMVYDDVVTPESVGTPEQIAKTTLMWELSDSLGARGPNGKIRKWHAGTRYHFADTYHSILDRGSLTARIYPATEDGTPEGKPVLLTAAAWAEKKRTQGPAVTATQMLLNPAAGTEALFREEWLSYVDIRPATLNAYLMVDPASSKKKGSDYTAMMMVGIDANWNKYLLDGIRDRLNLKERWLWLKQLRLKWLQQPGIQFVEVGYEKYGMQSDIEFFEMEMMRDKVSFPIKELAWPRDDLRSKYDRIQRMVPDFQSRRWFLPLSSTGETSGQKRIREQGMDYRIFAPIHKRDYEGKVYDLNAVFKTEFVPYPYSVHDDVLDACSRVYDMEPSAPTLITAQDLIPTIYADGV